VHDPDRSSRRKEQRENDGAECDARVASDGLTDGRASLVAVTGEAKSAELKGVSKLRLLAHLSVSPQARLSCAYRLAPVSSPGNDKEVPCGDV
jgi:hypothetical protein